MAGDFILAVASMMIARLKNDDVTLVLSQVRWFFSYLQCYYTIFFNISEIIRIRQFQRTRELDLLSHS